jgi:8-oxo-dGTP pyrophosphatase MutT (NUDIX family)
MDTNDTRQRQKSAGFIVRSVDHYLIGKTTGSSHEFKWTIFKGHVEEGESSLEAAIRELKEESGIDINSNEELSRSTSTSVFYEYSTKSKDVELFLLDDKIGVLKDFKPFCGSYFENRYGELTPEICDYKWVKYEDLQNHLFPSQRGIIDKLRVIEQQKQ